MPVTSPRRCTNQRPVIVATNVIDIDPVPTPTSSPQQSSSCQDEVMKTVRPLPSAISTSAALTTRRRPSLSISAAANGEISPYSIRLIDTAVEIVACDQPNSSCSGSSNTLGTDRNPAAPISVMKPTAA